MKPDGGATQPLPEKRTLLQRACLGLLRLFGWRILTAPLPGPKGVIIVYPHTSNWDFIIGLLYRLGTGLQTNWMGKDTMFFWPLRRMFERMGGVPINRREPRGFIRDMLTAYREREWLWLSLAPEGTRAPSDHLKSGFYQLAVGAGVPCGLGFIDYRTKSVGIQTFVRFSGNAEEDLAVIRDFYADKGGKFPEKASQIRFRR
ncbi:MAG: 1-acyl-sn-glycerol-3-phosphate acyltransferase [Gammaproteobacteria bacterium]